MAILDKAKRFAKRIEAHAAYKRLFDSADGKIVLQHMCEEGFVLRSTFVQGDSHATAMNEGTRRFVLSILRFMKKDHRELVQQIEESMTEHYET